MAKGVLAILGSSLLFALLPVFLRLAYQAGADPFPLLMARTGISAAFVGAFCLLTKRPLWLQREAAPSTLRAALAYAAMALCFNFACRDMEAGAANALFHVAPALVLALTWLRGRGQPSLSGAAAGMFAGVGCLCLALAPQSAIPPTGAALALAAALFSALYTLAVGSDALRDADPFALTFWVCVASFLSAGPAGLVQGASTFSLPAQAIGWACAAALLSTVAAMALFIVGTQHIGAVAASVLGNAEVLITPLLGGVLLSEPPSIAHLLGYGIITASCILACLPHGHKQLATDSNERGRRGETGQGRHDPR